MSEKDIAVHGVDEVTFSQVNVEEVKATNRHLKPRHIQLIGISGAIGTGLFIGTSSALKNAGPLGLVLGFAVYGLLVLSTFNAMGEMVGYLPIDGSYIQFAARFVDTSYGYAMGWVVFYNYAVTVAAEAVAVAGLFNYWNDTISNGLWCGLYLITIIVINVFGVKFFGEGEFYLSIFKVLLIMGLLVFTFITMLGGNPQHDRFGFRYWKNPGPFRPTVATGTWGNFLSFWSTFVTAAYSYGGPDYLAMTAGEAMYPRRVMPNVFRRVIWRLLVFYIGGTLAVGILISSTDPDLGTAKKGAGSSAFVLAAVRMGIPVLPSIINACILTSAWSCGIANSYTSSRVLYSLALRGTAPAFFKQTWRGVPTYCVLAVTAIGCLSFLSLGDGSAVAFSWLVNILGSLWIFNLALQHIIYIRFRTGVTAQGIDRTTFPYYRKSQLAQSYFCVVAYMLIFLTNGWRVFTTGAWDVKNFIFAYMTFPIFLVLYISHKLYVVFAKGGKWGLLDPQDIDLVTGKAEVDEDEVHYPPPAVTKTQKFERWLWG